MCDHFKEINRYSNIINLIVYSIVFGSVIAVFDFFDIISIYCLPYKKIFFTLLVSIALILVLLILRTKFFSLLKDKSVNFCDPLILGALFILTIYLIEIIIFRIYSLYKLISIGVLFLVLSTFLIYRIIYCKSKNNNSIKTIDFKDLYENKLDFENRRPIMITEKDVDYDLLSRDFLIDQLYYSIINSKTDTSFVIALEGEWGSGKTTIINSVKNRIKSDEMIIIDDFEPWEYGSNEALLTSMYNTIIKKAGIKYDVLRARKILKSINSIIADNSLPGKIANELLPVNSMSVNEVKTQIESFLIKNNKQIVFFIDNIDRTDSGNIIFLFKLIGTIFDISNITFVLAYDKKRLDLIFKDSLNIDSNYTEKIIQQVITVPNVRSEPLREVIDTCFNNIMTYYGINASDIKKYSMLSKFYSSSITNLRQFKRLINSVFYPVFMFAKNFCYYDLLVLETIKFFNYDIYKSIYDNKNFYISDDRIFDSELYGGSINKDQFNKDAKNYFDDIKNIVSDRLIELLASVFPYVKNYQNNQPVNQEYLSYDDVFKPAPRIYSAKYFEMYFSYNKNQFLESKKSVDLLLSSINEPTNLVPDINQKMLCIIHENDPHQFREFIAQFYSRINEIHSSEIFKVIEVLEENIYLFVDVRIFFGLGTFDYFGLIIADLLKMCNQNDFEKFVNSITCSYKKLNHLRSVIYWFESSHNTQSDDNRFSVLKEKYDSLCNVITAKKIDLYDNEYYHRHNAYGLFGSYNTLTDENRNGYFNAIISTKNIYRILGDTISGSIGSKYIYCFESKRIEEFGINIETINKLLENNPPKNNSEQFILEVYDKFLNNSGGDRENMEVYRDSEFIFEL